MIQKEDQEDLGLQVTIMNDLGFTDEEIERYARHITLPQVGGIGQRKLINSKVLVIGAGGLGSPLLLYLAAAGVGTIGIIDDDKVELSNLQRQIIHANDNINKAEENMLKLTCERADLIDGLSILELGCGWGAISLWMAKTYPNSKITSVSNSESQKEYIYKECEMRGITNLEVITADMNVFQTEKKFDRVVSVEMFEHMKNYDILLNKISNWLKDNGKLFVHIFTHKNFSYHFETEGKNDWMGKYFFTGGIMPSHNLLDHFNNDLKIVKNWIVEGTHYHRTAESWLDNMDQNKDKISDIFKLTYGRNHIKWRVYWRIFFMACSELWKTSNGNEWQVSHYLFKKK